MNLEQINTALAKVRAMKPRKRKPSNYIPVAELTPEQLEKRRAYAREYFQEYRQTHREERRECVKFYREEHRDEINAKQRERYHADLDKSRTYFRARYAANRDAIAARRKELREQKKEQSNKII